MVIEELTKRIKELEVTLKEKENIINNLKNEKDLLMSIIFISSDENIISSFICKNTDTFDILEKKFYEKYSEYKDLDNIFISNGRKINKNKSLEENKIKNNDIIFLQTYNYTLLKNKNDNKKELETRKKKEEEEKKKI